MSIRGDWLPATIAASGTTSSEVDLGKTDWDLLDIQFPTLTSCSISLQVAEASGGTFYALGSSINTGTITGAYATTFKLGGWRYIKVVSSATQASERLIRVRGTNY